MMRYLKRSYSFRMERMLLIPNKRIGKVQLKDTRVQIRQLLGKNYNSFRRTQDANLTDFYPDLGIMITYDKKCLAEFIEVTNPAEVFYKGFSLIGASLNSVLDNLLSVSDSYKEYGVQNIEDILRDQGVGLYFDGETVETVSVFGEDYYD